MEGTYDIFNIFINVRDVLQRKQPTGRDCQGDADGGTGQPCRRGSKLVKPFPSSAGIGTLTSLGRGLRTRRSAPDEEIARLQDADITKVAVDLRGINCCMKCRCRWQPGCFRFHSLILYRDSCGCTWGRGAAGRMLATFGWKKYESV